MQILKNKYIVQILLFKKWNIILVSQLISDHTDGTSPCERLSKTLVQIPHVPLCNYDYYDIHMSFLPFILNSPSSTDLYMTFSSTQDLYFLGSDTCLFKKMLIQNILKALTAADAYGKLPKHIPLKSTCYASEHFKRML